MNLFGLSPGELLLILMVAMVVLGPEKLPEVAASLGKWIREFRRATEELTAQFAGDNPLYEIQRALSLTDEPTRPEPAPEPAPGVVPEPAPIDSTVAAAALAPTVPSPTPVRSDYFILPPIREGIADEWTHGSLSSGPRRNGRAVLSTTRGIADEWIHGVPRARPTPPEVETPEVTPTTPGISLATVFPGPTTEPSLAAEPVEAPASETVRPNGKAREHPPETVEMVAVSAFAGDGREGDHV